MGGSFGSISTTKPVAVAVPLGTSATIRFVREATRVSLLSSEYLGENDAPPKIARDGTGMRPFVQESPGLGRGILAKDKAKRKKSGSADSKTNGKAKSKAKSKGKGRVAQGMREADKAVGKLKKKDYEAELERLQLELVKLQEYIKEAGLRVVVVFEGRDAAGKGGTIKRINEAMNPRVCRIAALPAPSSRERTQWYFQRYVAELPAAGEMVLFDRSWYNRAGVERVMGFCTEEEYQEFLRATPLFEEMLLRSNIKLIKYWFSVSDDEQERRFQDRLSDPSKHWKLSPMDLESRRRWVDYSRAKDVMFARTDTRLSPWWVVEADNKRRARLNTISHLLSSIPYEYEPKPPLELPERQDDADYVRPPRETQRYVPEAY
jgi:polyphosphate kinase 2